MNPDAETFEQLFETDYTKLFGRTVAGMDVEITVWSVNATTPPQPVAPVTAAKGKGAAPIDDTRRLFDPALADFVDASVVVRSEMTEGSQVQGPVAITEDETTIIVPSSRRAICQPDGCIDIVTKA